MAHKACQSLKYAVYDQMCFYRKLNEGGCRVIKPERTDEFCGFGETAESAKKDLDNILHRKCSHIPRGLLVGAVCQGELVGEATVTPISWWEWTKEKLSRMFS